MFSFIKTLFTSDPSQKLLKERDRKYKQAVEFQRSGNLREYARLIKEISDIEERVSSMATPQEQAREKEDRGNITSTDFIDYDGMGNQGRFPSKLNKKDRS